jgi:N,N'-diacetyllegionaminate synthase
MQLSEMVRAIRNVEKALGHGVKQPSASELRNRAVARKSICAARTIEAGEMLTTENLIAKRPGTGLSPMLLAHLLGTRASRPFDAEQQITL